MSEESDSSSSTSLVKTMEQRSEFMVSPNGTHEHFKTSHFLTPSVTSIPGPTAATSLGSTSKTSSIVKYKDLPFQVNFLGWRLRDVRKNWKKWVHNMQPLHHSTWEKAGIYDAILNSTFIIHRDEDLVFGFVEKWWCPETNTFVFPWGEATVTLEDMIVLGGYSVLGEPVSSNCDGGMNVTVEKLRRAMLDLNNSKAKKPAMGMWMNRFMDSGSEIEHEAFLAYWLSRFVFPFWRDIIGKDVVSIAVHLARGTKIALAPAILANIYQSLTSLKNLIASSSGNDKSKGNIRVSAPLPLVQVWVWERFPSLRPNPNSISQTGPRFARWHNLKPNKGKDFALEINSSAEKFQWRPYSAVLSKIYMDDEYWVSVASDLNEDLEGFVRCLRTSELVSLETDCIEQYLPHRVSRQFGMDQDIPGHVKRVNANSEIAWRNYIRPVKDGRIYVPGCLYEPVVTSQYFKWWKNLSEHDFVPPPPVFSPKLKRDENTLNITPGEEKERQIPSFSSAEKGASRGNGRSKSLKRRLVLSSSSSSDNDAGISFRPSYTLKHRKKENARSLVSSEKVNVVELSTGESSRDESRDEGVNHFSSTEDNGNTEDAEVAEVICKGGFNRLMTHIESSSSNDNALVSPRCSFAEKRRMVEAWDSSIMRSEKLVAQLSDSGSHGNNPSIDERQNHFTPVEDNGNIQEVQAMECEANNESGKEVSEGQQVDDGMKSRSGDTKNGASKFEPAGLGLEERIRNVAKLWTAIQSGKLKIPLKT